MIDSFRDLLRLLLAGGAAIVVSGISPPGPWQIIIFAAFLGRGSWQIARALLPSRPAGIIPLASAVAYTAIASIGHVVSLGRWLNHPVAWVMGAVAFASVANVFACRPATASPWSALQPWIGSAIRAPAFIRLGLVAWTIAFLANGILAAYGGITVWDSVVNYLPLVVDQVQEGSLAPPPRHPQDIYAGLLSHTHAVYAAIIALAGSLRGLNLVGWWATLMGGMSAAMLARECGAGRRWALARVDLVLANYANDAFVWSSIDNLPSLIHARDSRCPGGDRKSRSKRNRSNHFTIDTLMDSKPKECIGPSTRPGIIASTSHHQGYLHHE